MFRIHHTESEFEDHSEAQAFDLGLRENLFQACMSKLRRGRTSKCYFLQPASSTENRIHSAHKKNCIRVEFAPGIRKAVIDDH